jgi:hypothetical protein
MHYMNEYGSVNMVTLINQLCNQGRWYDFIRFAREEWHRGGEGDFEDFVFNYKTFKNLTDRFYDSLPGSKVAG